MLTTRPPAVAGLFYPAAPSELKVTAAQLLQSTDEALLSSVRGLIVPHAGWIYSGAIAAAAYRHLSTHKTRRFVIAGPAHRVALRGVAVPSASAFATPLGHIKIDRELLARALAVPCVQQRDDAHALEHAIEVQLPFLQTLFADFTLLPLVVGACQASDIAALFDVLLSDDVLPIISTDLSHFLPYADAQKTDHDTISKILSFNTDLHGEQACGAHPLNGFLQFAALHRWQLHCLAHCNSGDTAGNKDRVVGYASFIAH